MDLFKDYAAYYDMLYHDKNYHGEIDYIVRLLQQHAPAARMILELGCGTGTHALMLAGRGYTIHGIDLSDEMIERAREKVSHAQIKNVSFSQGDMRSITSNTTYDAVLALFHVMSYQTTDVDIHASFKSVAHALKPGGLFIFDFWFGPAVIHLSPEVRIKRVDHGEIALTRIAEPTHYPEKKSIDVYYTLFAEHKNYSTMSSCKEKHSMRYFFEQEIIALCDEYGLDIIVFEEWMSSNVLDKTSWNACVVSKKR